MRVARSEQLETLLEAMTASLEKDNLREAADILLRGMLRWTSSKAGFLGLFENRAVVRILSGAPSGAPATLRIPASAILGRAVGQREVLVSENPRREFPGDPLFGIAPPLRNFMMVPVHSGAEPLAMAFLANRRGRYSRDDRDRALLSARAFGVILRSGRERDRQDAVEARLRLAQKMEAVGRLAGGVAHDFNNLLTTILGQCEVLRTRLGDEASRFGELAEIRGAGDRAASLTRQLLAFGRKQPIQPRVIDLNEVVRGIASELQVLVGKEIGVRTFLAPSPWTVLADRGQLRQVLVDLALNARDAMAQGGSLTIETSNVDLDASYVEEHPSAVAGPHVMMQVADTGS